MGSSVYSEAAVKSHNVTRSATYSADTLAYTDDIMRGKAKAVVNQRLDPMGLKVRESRDSAAHPTSLAIACFFDVTGSMGKIPVTLRKKLTKLMGLLLEKQYVPHPHVLFGAVGDAKHDRGPLQIGQFEADVKMDEDIDAVWVEGGGGGGGEESYELAYYIAARHTSIDCQEKRGKKGYLFTIGDESPYEKVSKREVVGLLGAGMQENVKTADIIAEAQEKYHCFHLIVARGSNGRDASMRRRWKNLLGDNAIVIEEVDYIAETMALIIGMHEGKVDLATGVAHLAEYGVTGNVADAISSALVAVSARAIALGGLK